MTWWNFIREIAKYYDKTMWEGVGKFHLNDIIKTKLPTDAKWFNSTDLVKSMDSWSEEVINLALDAGDLRDKDQAEFCKCILVILRSTMCLGLAAVVCKALHATNPKLKYINAIARFDGTPTLFVPDSQGTLKQINLDDRFVTPNLQLTEQMVKALCEDGDYGVLFDAQCSPFEIGASCVSWCRVGLRQCLSGNKTYRTLKDVYKDLKEINSEYSTGLLDAISI